MQFSAAVVRQLPTVTLAVGRLKWTDLATAEHAESPGPTLLTRTDSVSLLTQACKSHNMATMRSTPCVTASRPASIRSRTSTVQVVNSSWTKVSSKSAVQAAGGKLVVEVAGAGKVLIVEDGGEIFAVSNKCTHLGLPLVGKTQFLQGKVTNGCITCSAHNTAFDLKTGEVKGEWCPTFPNIPFVGKGQKKPLPTYQSRVGESGDIEVLA